MIMTRPFTCRLLLPLLALVSFTRAGTIFYFYSLYLPYTHNNAIINPNLIFYFFFLLPSWIDKMESSVRHVHWQWCAGWMVEYARKAAVQVRRGWWLVACLRWRVTTSWDRLRQRCARLPEADLSYWPTHSEIRSPIWAAMTVSFSPHVFLLLSSALYLKIIPLLSLLLLSTYCT